MARRALVVKRSLAMSGKTTSSKAATAASKTLSSGDTGSKSKSAAGSALYSKRVRQHEEHLGPGRVQGLEGAERRPQFVYHEVGGRLGAVSEEAVRPDVALVRSFGHEAVAESKKGTPRGCPFMLGSRGSVAPKRLPIRSRLFASEARGGVRRSQCPSLPPIPPC